MSKGMRLNMAGPTRCANGRMGRTGNLELIGRQSARTLTGRDSTRVRLEGCCQRDDLKMKTMYVMNRTTRRRLRACEEPEVVVREYSGYSRNISSRRQRRRNVIILRQNCQEEFALRRDLKSNNLFCYHTSCELNGPFDIFIIN